MTKAPPRILSIAGSDSSGGAGIQADIKTITMLGGYAMTALTAATAQNSLGLQAIVPMNGEFVATQIASCVEDIGVDAIKIGMLHDQDIVRNVLGALDKIDPAVPVVLDPVMVSTSGAALIAPDTVTMLREEMFPRATVITPNLPELEFLTGRNLRTLDLMREAAHELAMQYGTFILAKGGHTDDNRVIDTLLGPEGERGVAFDHARIDTVHTHGTGCTLSSAIATLLGHGQPLEHSVRLARQFVYRAIESAPGFGAGNGPLGHQAVRKL